jgi:hypothetical protein
MSAEGQWARLVTWGAGAAWMTFWFWAFSLASSSSFFAYDQHSRLPIFVAALLGAGGIFLSAVAQWRARRSVPVACLRHIGAVALALSVPVGISALLSRAAPPWRPSADDAMGTGFDLLLLAGAGMASLVLLAIGLALRTLWRRGRGVALEGEP